MRPVRTVSRLCQCLLLTGSHWLWPLQNKSTTPCGAQWPTTRVLRRRRMGCFCCCCGVLQQDPTTSTCLARCLAGVWAARLATEVSQAAAAARTVPASAQEQLLPAGQLTIVGYQLPRSTGTRLAPVGHPCSSCSSRADGVTRGRGSELVSAAALRHHPRSTHIQLENVMVAHLRAAMAQLWSVLALERRLLHTRCSPLPAEQVCQRQLQQCACGCSSCWGLSLALTLSRL